MKKTTQIIFASLFVGGALLVTSCSKEDEATNTTEVSASAVTQSEDVNDARESSDDAADEATNAFSGSSMARIDGTGFRERCNITVDSSLKTSKILKLTFTGADCSGAKTRSGTITTQLVTGDKWQAVGAKMKITFDNFKVTRVSDQKSVTINGVKYITNVNGGIFPSDKVANVVHSIKGNLKMTFDNSTERSWRVTRKRTITLESGKPVVKEESDSSGTYISESGKTRDGNDFIVTIPAAITIKACGSTLPGRPKPVSGTIINTTGSNILTTSFGYKSLTEKVETCDATGILITFTDGTKTGTKYVPFK